MIKYDETTELASFAAYAIGYYYDESTKIDSAMKYYTWIQDNHPRSDQSDAVVNRLYTLNLVLNSLQIDTLSTSEIREENWELVFSLSATVSRGTLSRIRFIFSNIYYPGQKT